MGGAESKPQISTTMKRGGIPWKWVFIGVAVVLIIGSSAAAFYFYDQKKKLMQQLQEIADRSQPAHHFLPQTSMSPIQTAPLVSYPNLTPAFDKPPQHHGHDSVVAPTSTVTPQTKTEISAEEQLRQLELIEQYLKTHMDGDDDDDDIGDNVHDDFISNEENDNFNSEVVNEADDPE